MSTTTYYDYHEPVQRNLVVDYLVNDPDGLYVDGTFGGGGHTKEILKRLSPLGKVIAYDAD